MLDGPVMFPPIPGGLGLGGGYSSEIFALDNVTLYRAVGIAELDDVLRFGDYGLAPSGGKYFALTEEGVRNFAHSPFNSGRNMTVTSISVPRSFLETNGFQFADVGGAGPSVYFTDGELLNLYELMSLPDILEAPWVWLP